MPEEDNKKGIGTTDTEKVDAPTGIPTPGEVRNNYIICIGVGVYPNLVDKNLLCCKNDCTSLKNILVEDYSFQSVKNFKRSGLSLGENADLELVEDEQATLANIKSLFSNLRYHPDFRKNEANESLISHNLIIYYSGHGVALKPKSNETFFWVPSDYDGDFEKPDSNLLYSVFNELIPKLEEIRYNSLIIISDACQSGATFNLSNWFPQSTVAIEGSLENEPSIWAICSSGSNQSSWTSFKNSVFTECLLSLLRDNFEKKLSVEKLGVILKENYKLPNQKIFAGRLNLINNNIGSFYFIGSNQKEQKRKALDRIERLKEDIFKFNYSVQKLKLVEWIKVLKSEAHNNTMQYFVCMSVAPGYGIKLTHRHVFYSKLFPVPYRNIEPIRCNLFNEIGSIGHEYFDMKLISKYLGIEFPDLEEISQKQKNGRIEEASLTKEEMVKNVFLENMNGWLERLQMPFVFEIHIDNQPMMQKAKAEFVKNLLLLLESVGLIKNCKFPFFILLIDYNNEDYQDLTKGFTKESVKKFIVPKVEDVDDVALTLWKEIITNNDDEKSKLYDELFGDIIDEVKQECFAALEDHPGEQGAPPGIFLQALCKRSGCEDWITEILEF
jgi:hypothetical protein